MLEPTLHLVDQFYELYARTQELGTMTQADWRVVEQLQQQPQLNAELHGMLKRLLRHVQQGQIQRLKERLLADMLSHHPEVQHKLGELETSNSQFIPTYHAFQHHNSQAV